MTLGRVFNNAKYIELHNDNEFKKKSLEDNVYFTLRDIFSNAESTDIIIEVNNFNYELSNGVCFEERTDNFQYSNVLNDKKKLKMLIELLDSINEKSFEFIELDDDEKNNININEYLELDVWMRQFEELKNILKKYNKK